VIVPEMPIKRPNGVTAKQWRLAAIYPRAESAYAALVEAGYAKKTALKRASNILDRVGVKRARDIQQQTLSDRARGIMAVGHAALATSVADLKDLDPRDRLAAGFKAIELAHSIGENVEATGSADAWKHRQRRAIRLALHLGYVAGRRTQDVVLSPTHNSDALANQQNDKLT